MDFEIAIVGSGFAGSLLALICRRLGRSVVLIEKGSHPRFAIGESSSPLANLLLEELSDRYDLPRIRPLASWGTWQAAYPKVGCGLKRGFSFYGHEAGKPFRADSERRDQLLVAASPRDEVADTHWFRADFDQFLVNEAEAEGVEYLDRTELTALEYRADGVAVSGRRRDGGPLHLNARLLVDASGARGFVHKTLRLREGSFPDLPATQSLFTHFEGVRRWDEMEVLKDFGKPPYAVDDAALHHVFDGGWIWVLRFNNGVVSAGVAAAPWLVEELRLSEGENGWDRLLARFPSIQEQFQDARALRPFVFVDRLPFRSAAAAGANWALLPSAAAFVDPLLSTGFPLTLLGVARLADAIEHSWGMPELEKQLEVHGAKTLEEADTAAALVAALYASFADFELFAALSLLYFAAASFGETARRLGRADLAGSFLGGDHPAFGPALSDCCRRAIRMGKNGTSSTEHADLISRIFAAIEPWDVAGLTDGRRRRWHPMEAAPLLAASHKLGVSPHEIEAMLVRSGFWAQASTGAASERAGCYSG
jgi:FADH2 O2-dependent halogenase